MFLSRHPTLTLYIKSNHCLVMFVNHTANDKNNTREMTCPRPPKLSPTPNPSPIRHTAYIAPFDI